MENMKRLLEFRMPRTGELLSFRNKQYYVSKDGQVWNDDMKRYLKQFEMSNGYMNVHLFDDSGTMHQSIGVHALVASCFQRLLERGEAVHHADKNRKNNNLSNLKIITASEHQRQHILENWDNGTMDYQKKQVAQLSLDLKLIKVWSSAMEAMRNGFNNSHISNCCNGKRKTHHGFRWMWLEDYQKQKEERQELETLASS